MIPHMAKDVEQKQTTRTGVKLREMVKIIPSHERSHRGGQDKCILGKIFRRLGPLIYLEQVRAQRRYMYT